MATKKPMKMKRVDAEDANSSAEDTVGNMAVRQPVKTGGGVVVMSGDEGDNKEAASDEQSPSPSVEENRGTISVSAPDVSGEMEEVSYKEWLAEQNVDIASNDPSISSDPNKLIQAIVGKAKDVADKVLSKMKNDKMISEYRFIPIGMPMTLEVNPGRVQVLIDASGRVISVEIS